MHRMERWKTAAAASRWFARPPRALTSVSGCCSTSVARRSASKNFAAGKVLLEEGQAFALDTTLDPKSGSPEVVGVAYKDLPKDVVAGDTLLLADGLIVLDVEKVTGTRIETRVRVGGELSDRKGVNRQGGGISAPAISDKDREDIKFVAQEGIDYMAVSFARDAADIQQARSLSARGGR